MTSPTPHISVPQVNWANVAKDIGIFGTIGVGVLEVVENTLPSVAPSPGVQAVLSAVVALLTSILAVSKGRAVAQIKAAVGL